jgi:succinylarginine dihydrolase
VKAYEVNFDGLVGPTHNYGGLSLGNVASKANANAVSNPKQAAKQGLLKMKALFDLGLIQGVLAPQERPAVWALRRLGFTGADSRVLASTQRKAPRLFAACCSASSMWTANAATVSPSSDTANGKVHITPANLVSTFHRTLETDITAKLLKAVFPDPTRFEHHPALPSANAFGDEGAANHMRMCTHYGEAGVELFVYGRKALSEGSAPARFPARQTLEASQAISRLHGLDPARVIFAQQNPALIDAGVFHNDVIAVSNQNVLFFHEHAFLERPRMQREILEYFGDGLFHFIEVSNLRVSVGDAVGSYLFNSQLVTLPSGEMALAVPKECESSAAVWDTLQAVLAASNPINQIQVLDVKQSMRNGGGPACLRLRVVLTQKELACVNQAALFNDSLLAKLNDWVNKHYRDRLRVEDLCDPNLLRESRTALDELTQILALGSVYSFQSVAHPR